MCAIRNLRTKAHRLKTCGPNIVNCVTMVSARRRERLLCLRLRCLLTATRNKATPLARTLGLVPLTQALVAPIRSTQTLPTLRFLCQCHVELVRGCAEGHVGAPSVEAVSSEQWHYNADQCRSLKKVVKERLEEHQSFLETNLANGDLGGNLNSGEDNSG